MHNRKSPPIQPVFVIIFGIFAVSTSSIMIRYAQHEASSLVIAASRLTIATLFLAPIVWFKNRQELSRLRRNQVLLALLSGFFLALHFATWISSLEYTTVASSVVFVSTSPLWVAMMAPFLLKEKLSKWVVTGLWLAFCGSVLVGISDVCSWNSNSLVCPSWQEFITGRGFLGDMLALFGAIMAACYIMIGRQLRSDVSLTSYIFLVYGMAAVVLILIVGFTRQSFIGYSPITYVLFLLMALVPQLLGHSSFNWALGYLSAAYVSITMLGEPVGSTILAYFILQERPTWIKIFGAILILAGILLASKKPAVSKDAIKN